MFQFDFITLTTMLFLPKTIFLFTKLSFNKVEYPSCVPLIEIISLLFLIDTDLILALFATLK